MSDGTGEAPATRPNWFVLSVELMQVASAVSIGIMLLPLVVRLDQYAAWEWALLIAVALTGAILPFRVETADDSARAAAYYVVNEQRIATLTAVSTPPDVMLAIKKMDGFAGNGEELRGAFFGTIGEVRGGEYLDNLYKYLRAARAEARGERITIR